MKVLVLGAGRMGLRHCLGVLKVARIKNLFVVDVNRSALENAKIQLEDKKNEVNVSYHTLEEVLNSKLDLDIVIVAATAGNRVELCEKLLSFSPKYFLIEKPLGQSYKQVEQLITFFNKHRAIKAFVNLNTRLYKGYQKLKNDLQNLKQLKGHLTISINTGTVGIGANGIHYIDLIKYLTDASSIKIVNAFIDDTIIPSGRGSDFADFGGYAVLDYLNSNEQVLARVHLILSSQSTVLGPWEFVGTNGRVLIDEFEQTRFNKYRKADSELPVQRYAGDYLPMETEKFEVPFLNDLTEEWLNQVLNERFILPEIKESLAVHNAVFEWLNYSNSFKNEFPIT
jgi:predicted dehydrogenase